MTKLDFRKIGCHRFKVEDTLSAAGIPHTRKAIRKAILDDKVNLFRYRNYGLKTHEALCALVGIDFSPYRPKKWQVKCPHCKKLFDLAGNRHPVLK